MKNDLPSRRPTTRTLGRVWPLLVMALAVGCKRAPRQAAPAAVAQVPAAPNNLLATMVASHPEQTWRVARGLAGSGGALVPSSLALFAASALDLPAAAIDQLDTTLPMLGALVQTSEGAEPLLAIHVKDGPRLVEMITAPGGRYGKGSATADGITELITTGESSSIKLAVAGHYLIATPKLDSVRGAVPYVTLNVGAHPAPDGDLVVSCPHEALSGPITQLGQAWWATWRKAREEQDAALRQAHGGSAPDFGDPAEALSDLDTRVRHLWDMLSDIGEVSLLAELEPAAPSANLHLQLLARAATASGAFAQEASALALGQAERLLELPSSVAAALVVYDDVKAREEAARQKSETLGKVMGGRLSASDQTNIAATLARWARARGDWLSVGLLVQNGKRNGFWRGAVTDPGEMQRALVAAIRLLSVPAIAEPIASWIGDLRMPPLSDAPAGSTLQSVHVLRRPPKMRRAGRDAPWAGGAFDVVWSYASDTMTGSIGEDAKIAHDALLHPSARGTWRDDPRMVKALAAHKGGVALAGFVDMTRLGMAHVDPSTVIFAYGKPAQDSPDATSFTLDVPALLVLDYAGQRNWLQKP